MIFKIGDFAVLVHADGVHTLELDKAYKVIDIKMFSDGQGIALEDTQLDMVYSNSYGKQNEYMYYNHKRFTDIKYLRRKKLQKLKNVASN